AGGPGSISARRRRTRRPRSTFTCSRSASGTARASSASVATRSSGRPCRSSGTSTGRRSGTDADPRPGSRRRRWLFRRAPRQGRPRRDLRGARREPRSAPARRPHRAARRAHPPPGPRARRRRPGARAAVRPRARRVAEALGAAGVPNQLHSEILVPAWEKLAWNSGFNAVTTLTQSSVADVLADPASGDLVVTAMEEVDAVATALGIPVRRTRTEAVLADSVAGLPDFETSMLQDYRRGRRLEHDALNGAVVRAAARAGVPVPVNRVLLALLARLDPGRRRV